jgi:lipoprotein-releasing system permease protein
LYKVLLCWRYLLTRYLALVCIVSVTLGVATLIVVNSVMSGFSTKLKDRLHGLLSDIDIEALSYTGLEHPYERMQLIQKDPYLNEQIAAMTPTMEIFAILQYTYRGQNFVKPVRLIGIDIESRAKVGGFTEFLQDKRNRDNPSFALSPEAQMRYSLNHPPGSEDLLPEGHGDKPPPAPALPWDFLPANVQARWDNDIGSQPLDLPGKCIPMLPSGRADKAPASPPDHAPVTSTRQASPPLGLPPEACMKPLSVPEPAPDAPPVVPYEPKGIIVGYGIATYRNRAAKADSPDKDIPLLQVGDDIHIFTVGGESLTPVHDRFVLCDTIKTEMSEYDANYVYVPLEHLQHLRTMENRVTSIQIKLKDYREARHVVENLKRLFPDSFYQVQTWQDKQGPLLAAISIEKGILNVLLFMIIAVAGFGILAIFSMIVVEKTRDIGILKALGASSGGVMKIFLGYGLLLGLVGAALGTSLGLAFTIHINEIEGFLGRLTGQEIFPRDVYYFDKIPTDIQPLSILLINLGAVAMAVIFSILPALRAALLHPVKALRYE